MGPGPRRGKSVGRKGKTMPARPMRILREIRRIILGRYYTQMTVPNPLPASF
jgi:hypothetical protein